MIDYTSYKKISEYLEKEKLKELKEYLEKERDKNYLKKVRQDLLSFLRYETTYFDILPYIYILDDERLLVAHPASAYILNNNSIITQANSKYLISNKKRDKAIKTIDKIYEYMEQKTISDITMDNIEDPPYHKVSIRSNDGFIEHSFYKKFFDFGKTFLEEDIKYSIVEDSPVCTLESERGMGIIMGLKKD